LRDALRGMLSPILRTWNGRRQLARLGRLLTLEARLDGTSDDMRRNGELLLLHAVIARLGADERAVLFDVGANRGDWTAHAATAARELNRANVQVVAFEPTPATFTLLCDRLDAELRGGSVRAVECAMSDTVGRLSFRVFGPGNGRNTLTVSPDDDVHKVIDVRCDTIDAYAAREKIDSVLMIKIDAEGHDLAVLRGASKMLAEGAIRFIQFEYNQRWIDARLYLRDAFDLLLPLGYHVGKVTPKGVEMYDRWHFELESWRQGNYVAWLSSEACPLPTLKWWNA
jgi:FkbM family methyltransferase